MNNYIKIVQGHKEAGVESCKKYGINHKTTTFEAVKTLLYNLIKGVRYIEKDGAYVSYETINKHTIGIKSHMVVAMYCPKNLRGNGIISMLLDKCPKPLISTKGKDCCEIGRLYKIR